MCDHSYQSGQKVAQAVEDHDGLHVGLLSFAHVAQCTHDQEEYQDGCNAAERPNEQISENGNAGCLRNSKPQDDTDDQSADDTRYKTDAVPFFD